MLLAAAFPFPLFFAPHTFSSHPYFAACEVHACAARQYIVSLSPIGARCKANPSFSATASGIGLKRSKKKGVWRTCHSLFFVSRLRRALRFASISGSDRVTLVRRGIFIPHRSLSALAIPSLTGSLLVLSFFFSPSLAACEVHARAPRQRIASPFPIGARCKANLFL